jgi:hypothetical protein
MTRKPSYKQPGLPRVRPCLNCEKEKPIAARGLCDACRKKEDREEDKLNVPACGRKEQQADSMKLLGRLIEILNRVKVARSSRQIILQHFLPYLGLTPRTQSSLIVDLMGTPGPLDGGTDRDGSRRNETCFLNGSWRLRWLPLVAVSVLGSLNFQNLQTRIRCLPQQLVGSSGYSEHPATADRPDAV